MCWWEACLMKSSQKRFTWKNYCWKPSILMNFFMGTITNIQNNFSNSPNLQNNFITSKQSTQSITNLLSFIGSYKLMRNPTFIGLYKNCMNSMLWLIWMIFIHIQYLKYLNTRDIIFEWHTWMFMFNTQKSHNFMKNYIMIITWIWFKCKL
jgi:hypothetical protein